MELKNHMEIVVDRMLKVFVEKDPNICTCENCILDVKAYALNHLPPQYFVTEKGEVYTKAKDLTIQFETDVTSVLVQGIEKVKKHPRH
ncbi:late competence development ComFB family protein [Tindallia californiensis]|uniref:Competence protein ComFB n=1 Tax=Tindallia californiensis TaxID=159292 RepID=A0A1H3NJY3_9FIRM|nr:late competence development ComFB family protein [Tindallia californiensis]SDY88990.1 competence protein ComFB [Tindallia californiensis]